MLDLESRMEIFGVTVYRDLDNKEQFFYAAANPHIASEGGRPLFDLFTYNKGGATADAITGGFLNMAVSTDLGALQGRVERELGQRFGGTVNLAPIPYTKGTARVIALGQTSGGADAAATPDAPLAARGPRFIEKILGAGQPSLSGDNRAIFSFSLDEDGSAFFLNVLSGDVDARPVGVVYELEYVGLLPAYDLEITIDFKQSYDYMRTRFTLGTLFFRADVDNIVEELKRRESIKIREVARTLELSTPEAITARQERIDKLVKDLATGALFQPSLTPGQPKVQGDTITSADPTNTAPTSAPVRSALRDGPGAAIASGMGSTAGVRAATAGNPAGTTSTTTTGTGTTGTGTTGTGTTGTGTTGSSTTGTGTGTTGSGTTGGSGAQPQRTAADVWNQLGRPQAAFALKHVSQEEQRTVTYNLSQVSAQKQTIAPQNFIQFMADSRDLNRHVQLINLNHPFFQRININVTGTDVDFAAEGVRQMTVQLRYGQRPDGTFPKDTAEVILRPGDQAKDFTFFADGAGTQSYEYKLIVDYKADFGIGVNELRMESAWLTTDARSLAVHPRMLGRVLPIELRLPPNVPPGLTELQARVRYVNAARGVDDSQLVILRPNEPSANVIIRLADATEQFSMASTVFYDDGTSEELATLQWPDPMDGSAENALVLAPPVANRLSGDIIMQDPLDELESVLVDTQVTSAGSTLLNQTYELKQTGAAGRALLSVRLPQGTTPGLRFQERRIYKDGGVEVEGWQEATSTNLLVGVPAADVKTVLVRWVGPDPTTIGISLVLVDLLYEDPDGDPEYKQEKSVMIESLAESRMHEWKIRLPAPGADSFQWRTNFFYDDGTNVESDFQSTNRSPLIIRPIA